MCSYKHALIRCTSLSPDFAARSTELQQCDILEHRWIVQPTVSILIPVYNRKGLIGPCIESALAQTFKEIEVVVCDNRSTDGTWEVLQEFAARDPRVRVFQNPENVGPVRNWARCAQEARAPYSKILFSDDLLLPRYVETAIPYIQQPGVGLVFTACKIGETPNDSRVEYRFGGSPGPWEPGRFLLGHVYSYNLPCSPAAALFHTADIRDLLLIGGPPSLAAEFLRTGAGPDLLLLLEAEYRHGRVAHIPEPLVFFRAHANSITIREPERVLLLYRRAIAGFIAQNRPSLLRRYLSGVRWNLKHGQAEVSAMLRDLELAQQQAPTDLEYTEDMIGRVWNRLRRQLYRSNQVQPFAEQ